MEVNVVINMIGAGHLGQTLARLLSKEKTVKIGSVCNQSAASTQAALQFIGDGEWCATIEDLPPADITFITTPDSRITEACGALSQSALKPGAIVVHCSGSLTSDALDAVRKKGGVVASIHPMRSFAQPALSVEQFRGTYCAIEGDLPAVAVVQALFESMGAIVFPLDKAKKSLYHAAGVFASNYLITLSSQALSCLEASGVKEDVAMAAVLNIMKGTLANLEKTQSPGLSLTGPIQRADTATIQQHQQTLTDDQQQLYALLGRATIPLTTLNEEQKQQVADALGR